VDVKDVIIAELLPDPSPIVGLPEAEFAEVYNRSTNAIDLAGWKLSDQTASCELAYPILLPGEYIIITSPGNAEKFSSYGKVLSAAGFPSLNNAGDILTLKTADGRTIDSVAYDIAWYRDDEKADGGWALEIIDPENICADKNNWMAAEAGTGGSPGKRNSVFANNPDTRGPKLVSAMPLQSDILIIEFDEKLENRIPSEQEFTLDPPLPVTSVAFADQRLITIQLTLGEPMQTGRHYTLTIGSVYDCPGNKIQEAFSRADLLLPDQAVHGDIIVNEILFNPRPNGVDFVEVYNRSEKTIDLKDWSLNNFSGGGKNSALISAGHLLIHPGEYRVFTEDKNILKGEYVLGAEEAFSEGELPAFDDDEGSAVLIDDMGAVVDSAHYSDSMHSPFVSDNEGVSLERISFSLAGSEPSNWRSASSASGYATPGYVNSNRRSDAMTVSGSVIVEPEIIQPFVNAQDFAQIRYHFDKGGFLANVRILDQQGRSVRDIAENELLGTEGFFRWDGDLDNGVSARTGYYMVWFEIFDERGTVTTYRRRVVIY